MADLNNEELRRNTKKVYSKIASSLDPKGHVVDKLFEEDIITTQQLTEINDCPDKKSRAAKLLSHLFETAHPRAFVVFIESLKEEYDWIARLIDDRGMNTNDRYFLFSEGI